MSANVASIESARILTKRFVTRKELADITGISARTYAKWGMFGRGPKYKMLGGVARYDLAEVERWLAERPERGGGNEAA
ncbi:MAG: DNA-binding protein [Bryobacterales bacterium]|nr:DNA-binding protein [Bryobacterales bacterium]